MSDRTQPEVQQQEVPTVFDAPPGDGMVEAMLISQQGVILGFILDPHGSWYALQDDGLFTLSAGGPQITRNADGSILSIGNVGPPAPATAPTTDRPVTEKDTEDDCHICQEPFTMDQTVTVLPCEGHSGHHFHPECITEWFTSSRTQTCPMRCTQRSAN